MSVPCGAQQCRCCAIESSSGRSPDFRPTLGFRPGGCSRQMRRSWNLHGLRDESTQLVSDEKARVENAFQRGLENYVDELSTSDHDDTLSRVPLILLSQPVSSVTSLQD